MYEFRVSEVMSAVDGRRRVMWETIGRQPGWVTRAALWVFAVIILLPLALLFLLALAAAIVIFGVLALVHRMWTALTGGPRSIERRSGRENVRIRQGP